MPSGTRQRQLLAIQPQAAAGAAAAGEDSGTPPAPPQPPKPKPRRELSLQQRWRAAKFKVSEAAERLSEAPPVAAVVHAVAALSARLQPLYAAWELLQRKWEALLEVYNEFLVEETKRQWRWSNVYGKELAWWSQAPPFLAYFVVTVVYEAFMPVSFLAAVAVPLWYAWVLWDDWWRSPIFLALLLTAPLKWVPWADMCLVWPGLI
ncbi:hypothetical protein CHLNCDRAFT_136217 [Chlorella variabilis]|uniref:Uncharacterized protein n=1 Tax=Chlorella variabilis TaxID=554065 RepID=E1ZJ87_CHLVA|nr:hypothetical protein CHLNCDRAFT_136217 [Chlorella variabilis]EFN54093.1 hypothetical protein CHLNCDRAFT_136217 [Chlorella variabilis]|eukprot:XP_005846195.1 hypothetical protein CHLNCDRAFT_136217 [Chlorella variabilis]